jgi:hypothetical protein
MNIRVVDAPTSLLRTIPVISPGASRSPRFYAGRISALGTTTVFASTCYVSSIVATVASIASGTTLTIQNREATPKGMYLAGTATQSFLPPLALTDAAPIIATNGIDIVMAGSTPAVVDVFITYWA